MLSPSCPSHPPSYPCSRLHPEGVEARLPAHCLPAEVRLCSKLELLDRMLVKLKAGGHRVSGHALQMAARSLRLMST